MFLRLNALVLSHGRIPKKQTIPSGISLNTPKRDDGLLCNGKQQIYVLQITAEFRRNFSPSAQIAMGRIQRIRTIYYLRNGPTSDLLRALKEFGQMLKPLPNLWIQEQT
jgi:hypothetical protein